jgi:large subunit ribosomal protein L32
MAVPKQRHTKSRRDKRRANIFLKTPNLTTCPKCGKPILPHSVCPNCGYYKGVEVIDVLKKLTKKEKKQKEKEMKAKEKEEREKTKEKPLTWEEMSRK